MAGIKERLIQVILRGKDLLSPEANKSKKALDELRASGEQLRVELDKSKEDNNLVRSLNALGKESERAEKTAERTAARVVQLRDELDKSPDSKGLAASLKAAESEAEKAQKALDGLAVKTVALAEEAKKAGIDTSKLSDEEKRLAAELVKAKGAVTDNVKATSDLQKEQSAAARSAAEQKAETGKLGDVVSAAGKRVLVFAAAYISLKTAMSAVKGVTNFVLDGFKAVFTGAGESEQVLAQLNAALNSTENAIGITADELQRMGLEMRKASMLSTEQITEMQVALLTYTDIAKEEFPRALQVAIDQQQRLGISITQSAELVGKALQDPSKAMVALGRQGFKLEESQKTLLKQMEDTGRSAEAQAIIMDMLAESYGGSAAAARYGTFKGIWKGITDIFEDFKSKIADSGSFDLLKEKLQGFSDLLTELESDGTLDALAASISSAFEVGLIKVEDFIRGLANVDFKQLTQDSTEWLNNFSQNIDDAMIRVQLFFAPFKTLFNLLQSGFTATAMFVLSLTDVVLAGIQKIGSLLPEALGGKKLAQSMYDMRATVRGVFDEMVQHILDNNDDIAAAWDTNTKNYEDNQSQQSAAARKAEREKQAALKETELGIDVLFAKEQQASDAYRMAAVEGRRAIENMVDALQLIDSTSSVAELEKLRKALLKAYQEGRISQQEFEQGTGVLNGKIKETGKAASDSAKDLKTLNGVMNAIAKAANDIDTRAARVALDKLYKEGKVNAKEHAKAQEELNKKVAELKPAADNAKKSVDKMSESLDSAGSGLENVGNRAEGASASMEWFMGIINEARAPLEQMSDAARDAFNELQGINVKPEVDTSSLEGTTQALIRTREEAGQLELAMSGLYGANISDTLSRWATMTKQRGKAVEISFLEQKAALQKLQASYESGGLSAAQFAGQAEKVRKELTLLDESDLSLLDGAIEAAKQKMDQLADSTKSTLQSLNDELLQLQGTQEDIEKSKMDSRRRDLQAQIVDARKEGDDRAVKNLQQALKTLSEIESERERAARNKTADEAKAQAEKSAAAKEPASQKQEPTKIIKLQVGNKSVDVGVDSAGDEAALLSILEQAGLRSM